MGYVTGTDRKQLEFISLDLMVHPESFVRIIDAFVDHIDLSQYDFKYSSTNYEGRPPYDPASMLKLYLYGYKNGIRSCRKLEKSTKINIEVMWLLNSLKPHYKTIANFRSDNPKALRKVFKYFVRVLKGWGLIDGKHIVVDSFKVRAQNSLKNNFNASKFDRHYSYIEDKIKAYEMAKESGELREEELKAIDKKIEYEIAKWNRYCDLEEELIESGEDQISTTDKDARAVILHRNIVNVGYNIQAVSESKNKMMVGMDTGDVNDTHALSGMVEESQANTGTKPVTVLADKGYHTGSELERCEEMKVKTYVSPKASAVNNRYDVFSMDKFKYHAGTDTYRCPNNEILRTNGTVYQRKSKKRGKPSTGFKHYRTKACAQCPIKDQCTTSNRGRVIQRQTNQGSIDRNNKRVENNPEYYRQRQQLIEHQFGTFKRQWGFTYVLVKGKEKVLGEVSMLFTVYNLWRSMSILDFKGLMSKIKALKSAFLSIFVLRRAIECQVVSINRCAPLTLWNVRRLKPVYEFQNVG